MSTKTTRVAMLALALVAMAASAGAGPALAAGPIAGKVTDTSAAPLAGIEVCAVDPATFAESCASTDAGGEYSIPGSGPGAKVHFFNPGNAAPSVAPQWYPNKAHPEEAVPVTEADIAAGVDAVLAKGATVNGELIDETSRLPIQGVEICPTPTVHRAGERTFCAVSDGSGKFVLRNLAGGSYYVEFRTSGKVNYVDEKFAGPPIPAGGSIGLTAEMRRGVEVEGSLTEAGTGNPVVGLGPPYATPAICAVDPETEEPIKCTTPGPGGTWSIPGLPPNRFFVLSLAVDGEASDGYVGQWWQGVDWLEEALLLAGGGGALIDEVDAVLVRGEDLVPSTEEPSTEEHGSGTGTGRIDPPVVTPATPLTALPAVPPALPRSPVLHCGKGTHKVTKSGHQRCVKIKKKHRPRRHRHQKRPPADAHRLPDRVP